VPACRTPRAARRPAAHHAPRQYQSSAHASAPPPPPKVRGAVGIITLNRPKALNALSPTMVRACPTPLTSGPPTQASVHRQVRELVESAVEMDANPSIGAIIITGAGDKAFAAGAGECYATPRLTLAPPTCFRRTLLHQ